MFFSNTFKKYSFRVRIHSIYGYYGILLESKGDEFHLFLCIGYD